MRRSVIRETLFWFGTPTVVFLALALMPAGGVLVPESPTGEYSRVRWIFSEMVFGFPVALASSAAFLVIACVGRSRQARTSDPRTVRPAILFTPSYVFGLEAVGHIGGLGSRHIFGMRVDLQETILVATCASAATFAITLATGFIATASVCRTWRCAAQIPPGLFAIALSIALIWWSIWSVIAPS